MALRWASQLSGGTLLWGDHFGVAPVPSAPTGVAGAATGGTTAALSLADTNAGAAQYRWQLAPVSTGIFADAVGAANPSAAGVTTFAATGLTPAAEYLVRARAESAGGNSAYAQGSSSFWSDNTGGGGGAIPTYLAVGRADESSSALALSFVKRLSVGLCTEVNTALPRTLGVEVFRTPSVSVKLRNAVRPINLALTVPANPIES